MKIEDIVCKYLSTEVLTEEAKVEITTLFDAAVSEKSNELVEAKEEELKEKYSEDLVEFKNMITDKLNDYIELSVDDFLKENEEENVDIVQTEMAKNVLGKLINVLQENYIEVSPTDIDAVKDLSNNVKDLKGQLDEMSTAKIEAENQIEEYKKSLVLFEMTKNLTDVEREKIISLIENVDVNDIDEFKTKAKIIIENFVEDSKKKEDDNNSTLIEEDLNLNSDDDNPKNEIDCYLPE